MLPAAYRGRILSVDLTSRDVSFIATDRYASRYLGGRGIATALYFDHVPPEATADGPDNALIAMTGPLAGMPAVGGSRWGLFAKSPSAIGGERFCYGNLGGSFGAEMKFAGLDGIMIRGIAAEPTVLVVEGGPGEPAVRFEAAGELVGMGAETGLIEAKRIFGNKARSFTIGPAGEAQIPFASVLGEGGASCSGGMGAVMGAKNLKAVVAFGHDRKVPAENPDAMKEITRRIRSWDRGNVKVWGLDFMAQGPETRKMPCHGCIANCLRVKYTASDGSTGKFMCQSRFFYMALSWAYYGEENDAAFRANRLCDELGLDTWAVQDIVDWLIRCRDSGALSNDETGLELEAIGSYEFVETLLHMIARRDGFGALLSRGAEAAAAEIGGPAAEQFHHHDPYEPRYCPVNTFLVPFETRIPIQQLHEAGLTLAKWSTWAKGVDGAHVSTEVVTEIARRFWGGEQAADFTNLEGKADAARRIQDRQLAKECLCVCDWMYPVLDIPPHGETPETNPLAGLVGDPALEAEVLRAAIGGNHDEEALADLGHRVFQLQRALLLREGHRPLVDDVLPAEWHEQPLSGHVADPDCLVPGPGGRTVNRLGATIDMDDYLPARDEYYALRGWDARSGLQTRRLLEKLDMGDVADELESRGLLAGRAKRPSWQTLLERRLRRWRNRLGRSSAGAVTVDFGPPLEQEEILDILRRETRRYADQRISHNFRGWDKDMQYIFPDINGYFVIPIIAGVPGDPACLDSPLENADIEYEMDSPILRAMDDGRINGMQAYQKRLLKTRASFGDLMKLQSLNKLN